MNKKVILIGCAALLLVGGGTGGLLFFKRHGDASAAEAPAAPTASVPVRIPFLAVPVIENNVLRYYTIVAVTIETPSAGDAQAVKRDLPRVVDGLLDAFHTASNGRPIGNQSADAAALSERLTLAIRSQPIGQRVRNVVVSTDHPTPR